MAVPEEEPISNKDYSVHFTLIAEASVGESFVRKLSTALIAP